MKKTVRETARIAAVVRHQGAQKIEEAMAIESVSGSASPTRHQVGEVGPRGGIAVWGGRDRARVREPRAGMLINGGTLSGVPPYADEVS